MVRNNTHAGHSTGTIVGVIALILSLIALGLAWFSYTRPTANIEQEVSRQIKEIREESQFRLALTQARSQLQIIKAGIQIVEQQEQAGESAREKERVQISPETFYPRAKEEVIEMRQSLQQAFQTSKDRTSVEWNTVQTQLQQLEQQLENRRGQESIQTIDAINTLLITAAQQ